MLWQNSSSIEWLAQFLMKRFLPKSTNSLCTRYQLWSRTSVVRMWACKAAFRDACYVWTASLLEVVFSSSLTQPAQGQVKQPKASIVNKSQHQAKIVVHVVAQNYLHGYTEMFSCTCYPWQAKSKSCVILGSPPVRSVIFCWRMTTHTTASQNKCQEKPKNVQGCLHQEIYLTLSYHVYQHNWRY